VADARIYEFAIPAQELSPALLAFARTTGVSLLVARRELENVPAPALEGLMTAPEALQLLLADTPLGFRFVDRKTVSISVDHRTSAEASAVAEPPVPVEAGDETIAPIEEILVYSRRRSENQQAVPIPISVMLQEQIEDADIRNLQDVALRVPGLTVSYFSLGQPNIHMRGIGSNDDGAALDNSVVLFLDDVYVGRISTIDVNMLDLDRIEVLRGPQGTLYGKNAIGGAINLSSTMPAPEAGADFSATIGNLDYRSVNARLNGPLWSPGWMGRLALSGREREGWQDNIVIGGEEQHDDKNYSLRAKLLYQPGSNLEWFLGYSLTHDDFNSTGRIPVVGRVPLRVLDESGQPSGETRLPTELFDDLGGSPERATNGLSGFTERTIQGLTSRFSLALDQHEFTSITAYRDSEFEWLEDSTGLPGTVTDQITGDWVDETHRQFSQEFRWSSGDDRGRNYVAGIFYLYEETDRDERFPFVDSTARTRQNNIGHSFALFGEASYHIDHAIKLTLGGRYTYDRKELDQFARNGGAPAIILEDFELKSTASWRDFSPSAALSWQFRDNAMLFARIARGFKNGGFQGAPGTKEVAGREIDPESAVDYELGLKSRWLRERLQFNINGFYTRYEDLQVVQFRTVDNFGLFETSNAGSADLKGVETEFILRALEGLEVSGSYAWLDASYDEFEDVEGRDFTGNHLRQAPRHSLNLATHYRWSVDPGELGLRLDYRYQSRSFREPDNSITVQPSFELLDASFSYYPGGGDWEFTLWSKNLLDEEYISHLYVLGGNDYALYGTPRTYGVSLRWSNL
jgi:iron complex outermembrane receptor protein